jgi:hypothetical protein
MLYKMIFLVKIKEIHISNHTFLQMGIRLHKQQQQQEEEANCSSHQ